MAVLADDHEKPASIIPRRFPAIKLQRSGKEPVLTPEPRDEILDNSTNILIENTTTTSTTQNIKTDIELTTTTEKPVAIIDVQQPPASAEIDPAIIHVQQHQPIVPAPVVVPAAPIIAAPEPVLPTVVNPPPLPIIRPVPLPPAIMVNRPPYFMNNFLPPPPMFFNRPMPYIPDPDFLPMFPPNNGFIPQFDYIPYRPMINRPFGPYGNGPMGTPLINRPFGPYGNGPMGTPLIRPWPPAFGGYQPQHGMGVFAGQSYHGVWRF